MSKEWDSRDWNTWKRVSLGNVFMALARTDIAIDHCEDCPLFRIDPRNHQQSRCLLQAKTYPEFFAASGRDHGGIWMTGIPPDCPIILIDLEAPK